MFGYDRGSREEAIYRDLDQPWDRSGAARFNAFFARLLETVADAPVRPSMTQESAATAR